MAKTEDAALDTFFAALHKASVDRLFTGWMDVHLIFLYQMSFLIWHVHVLRAKTHLCAFMQSCGNLCFTITSSQLAQQISPNRWIIIMLVVLAKDTVAVFGNGKKFECTIISLSEVQKDVRREKIREYVLKTAKNVMIYKLEIYVMS